MSILPPQPDFSAIDAAFVDLVFAFLEQVLHVEKPARDAIKRMEITETYDSMMRKGWYQQWAVKVLLTTAIPGIGDKFFFAVDNHSGHYAIGTLYFQPGWKPQEGKPLHQIGIDETDTLFRCAVCGDEWLFNPLMFQDDPNPEKRAIIYCPGKPQEEQPE